MKEMKMISKKFGVITRLGLSLLMSASLALVQGCDETETTDNDTGNKTDKPVTTNPDKPNPEPKPTFKTLTVPTAPDLNLTGKSGATSNHYTALGRNGDGSTLYFSTTDDIGIISSISVDGKVTHKEMRANEKADNTSASDYNFMLTGLGTDKDTAVIKKVVPGPGKTAVIAVDKLGRYLSETLYPINHKGGVLDVAGDTIVSGRRNTKEFFPGLSWNRDIVNDIVVTGNEWIVFFNNDDIASAKGTFGSVDKPVEFIKANPAVAAATVDGTNLYLADTNGKITKGTTLGKEFVDIVTPENLKHSDEKNTVVTSMAVVDGKLLIGFEVKGVKAATRIKTGGVFVVDTATGAIVKKALPGYNITSINPDGKGKLALITSKNAGIIFYIDGDFVSDLATLESKDVKFTGVLPSELLPGKDKEGNILTDDKNVVVGAAENSNGDWYVAVSGKGIYHFPVAKSAE